MKKIFLLLTLILSHIIISCNDKTQLTSKQLIIDSLKYENASLVDELNQKKSYIEKLKIEMNDLSLKTQNNEKSSLQSTGDENAAILAIKYMLKMYHPEVKYSNIRTVKKYDATIDVILDIPGQENYHKYYNVSTFQDGSNTINSDWGLQIY